MHGIDLDNNKYRESIIRDNKHAKFSFLPFQRRIKVDKVLPVILTLEKFKSEKMNEAEVGLHLSDIQENEPSNLSYDHKESFATDEELLIAIVCHEMNIIMSIERPSSPLFSRPSYLASPKSGENLLELHIKELLRLGVIRKVGRNEEVEICTPVILAWHDGKSIMV
ncbi:hypothetical protein O181_059001 [Austropuccinia psidii MF-1]|uniref:Uncharacterized protein n=1 Tax=Austropuccinia psidii MF-1 TaxID=1389203 RepID=A0A9Q3EBE4_9BASI|nr:hypothetical protein [Austropuccinia psidii MF-1]